MTTDGCSPPLRSWRAPSFKPPRVVTFQIPWSSLRDGSNSLRLTFGRTKDGKRIAFLNGVQMPDESVEFPEDDE